LDVEGKEDEVEAGRNGDGGIRSVRRKREVRRELKKWRSGRESGEEYRGKKRVYISLCGEKIKEEKRW